MICRVLLADDHRIVLEGLSAVLDKQPDMEVVARLRDGREAVRAVREQRPDVVVIDISMRGMNGIEATRRIKAEVPEVKVLCLSMHSEAEFVADMLRAGASGYLLKEDAVEMLVGAIRKVMTGQSFLSPEIAGSVVELVREGRTGAEASPFSLLTEREREVLQLLAEGHTSREIAERMHISARTVGSHRESLKQKLGIQTVAGLTRYAIQHGLTSVGS